MNIRWENRRQKSRLAGKMLYSGGEMLTWTFFCFCSFLWLSCVFLIFFSGFLYCWFRSACWGSFALLFSSPIKITIIIIFTIIIITVIIRRRFISHSKVTICKTYKRVGLGSGYFLKRYYIYHLIFSCEFNLPLICWFGNYYIDKVVTYSSCWYTTWINSNFDFSKYSLIRNNFWTQWIQKIGSIYELFYTYNL